jgi:hypothetical protein
MKKIRLGYWKMRANWKFRNGAALSEVNQMLVRNSLDCMDSYHVLVNCGVPYKEAKYITRMTPELKKKLELNGEFERLNSFRLQKN